MLLLSCAACGHDTCQRPGLRFCPACGSSLTKACAGCRHEGLVTDRHCGGCGLRHREAGEVAAPSPYAQLPADEARRLAEVARETLARLGFNPTARSAVPAAMPVAVRHNEPELADARRA